MRGRYFIKIVTVISLLLTLVAFPALGTQTKAKPVKKPVVKVPVIKPVIKIGMILPLSGDMAEVGQSSQKGVQIALDLVKNKVGNFNIQTVIYDDKDDENTAINGAKKLITQDKVQMIIGSADSKCSIPISEIAEKFKVPQITPTATNPSVTVNDYGVRKTFIFRGCFIDPYQGKLAATFILESLKLKNVAVMYNIEYWYSSDMAKELKLSLEKNGGKVTAFEGYTDGQEDFSTILDRIEQKKPEVLYLPDYYDKASLIAKQVKERGIKCIIIGSDGWDSDDLDYPTMEGSYFTNFGSSSDPNPLMQRFVQLYKSKYGSQPDLVAISAYDATIMALNAITRANSSDPNKLKAALQATKDLPTTTGKITIDKNGNPIKAGVVVGINGGKPVYKATISPLPSMLTSSVLDQPYIQQLKETKVAEFTLVPYESDEFDMLVPKGWTTINTPNEVSGIDIKLIQTSSNEDQVYLSVMTSSQIYDILTKNGLDNGGKVIIKLAQNGMQDFLVTNVSQVMVSEVPAVQLTGSITVQSQKYRFIERFVIIHGKCYDMVLKAEPEKFDKYQNMFTKCLDSIKIYYIDQEDEMSNVAGI